LIGLRPANAYGFDRWVCDSPYTPSSTGQALRFTSSATAQWSVVQRIEDPARLSGKTLTLSARFRSQNAGDLLVLRGGQPVLTESFPSSPTGWVERQVAFAIPSGSTTLQVGFRLQGSGWVEFEWIKLEEGSVATPWILPDRATEALRCHRFYQRYAWTSSGGMIRLTYTSSTEAYALFYFTAPMRGTAAFSSTGSFQVRRGANTVSAPGLQIRTESFTVMVGAATVGGRQLMFAGMPSGAAGETAILWTANPIGSPAIAFDSEI
jgi:hypothetical protein